MLTYIAPVVSASLLATLWSLHELKPRGIAIFSSWFVIAAYCQFFASSTGMHLAGLLSQTVLALVLAIRWRLRGLPR